MGQKNLELPSNYYNLRSRIKTDNTIEANFALIKKKDRFYFKGQECQLGNKLSKNTENKAKPSSILKSTNKKFSHAELWRDW